MDHVPPAPLPCTPAPWTVRIRSRRHQRQWRHRETWFHWLGGEEGLPLAVKKHEARRIATLMLDSQVQVARRELGDALAWGLGAPHPRGTKPCATLLCEHRRQYATHHATGMLPAAALIAPTLHEHVRPAVDQLGLDPTTRAVVDKLAAGFPGTLAQLVDVATATTS